MEDVKREKIKARCVGRIVNEVTEIELHPENMYREDGLCSSKPWKPLFKKKWRSLVLRIP
jgi:hypothetical protein